MFLPYLILSYLILTDLIFFRHFDDFEKNAILAFLTLLIVVYCYSHIFDVPFIEASMAEGVIHALSETGFCI